jgi:hypothetical protein
MAVIDELKPSLDKVEIALKACNDVAASNPEREKVEAALCLATREAYSDFHSLTLVAEKVNSDAKRRLSTLLHDAIAQFRIDDFANAVQLRLRDFERFCTLMESEKDLLEFALEIAESTHAERKNEFGTPGIPAVKG